MNAKLTGEALAQFVVLENRVRELEEACFTIRTLKADLMGLQGRIERLEGEQPAGQFLQQMTLRDAIGPDLYKQYVREGYESKAFGIPIKLMSTEDLRALVAVLDKRQRR